MVFWKEVTAFPSCLSWLYFDEATAELQMQENQEMERTEENDLELYWNSPKSRLACKCKICNVLFTPLISILVDPELVINDILLSIV